MTVCLENTVHWCNVEIYVTDISSFEISEDILRNQKIMIGLNSFSNLRLIYLPPFGLSTTLLEIAKLH